MSDKSISQLTGATTPLAGTEVVPVVQSGSTKKVSVDNLTAGKAVSGLSFAVTGSTAPANGAYLPAANTLGLASNSTDAVWIDSSQRVLINLTARLDYGGNSSLAKLQALVKDSATNTVLPALAVARKSTGTPAAGVGVQIDLVSDNAYSGVSEYGSIAAVGTDLGNISGDLVLKTMLNNSSTEKLRIKSTGDAVLATAGKGVVMTNAAGTVTKRMRLNDAGDGLVFENV